MLIKSLCLISFTALGLATISSSNSEAQTGNLVTGYVTNSYMEGTRFAVELNQTSSCGSNKFISLEGQDDINAVQDAVTGAEQIEGIVSILVGNCIGGSAEIRGISYGPDF